MHGYHALTRTLRALLFCSTIAPLPLHAQSTVPVESLLPPSTQRVQVLAGAAGDALPQPPQLEQDGAAALGVSLRRLGTTRRVLMIGAHPDDENTALLAELALGAGADVAYLSLTRGEGGQNLIGPELQEALGVIRSEELLAARRLDGARQFFTRAYDFGFSRSAEETLQHWPRDAVLSDMVEIIRGYRPDVLVSVFSGTPEDGHGHHQAAGILARQAFEAAADPSRFPEQLQRGLTPHRVHHLFQSMWRPPANPPITVATGAYDALFGRSRHQIAMQSRSRHRSQDMGAPEPLGPQQTALRLLATSHPTAPAHLFTGVDTTLLQHARSAGVPAGAQELLRQYEWVVQELRRTFNPLQADALVIPLADATHLLRRVQRLVPETARTRALHTALDDELIKAGEALRRAAGVVVDVSASRPLLVAGEAFTVDVTIWNGGASPVGLQRMLLLLPDGWTGDTPELRLPRVLRPNEVVTARFSGRVPADATPTQPYYLAQPRDGALYRWHAGAPHNGLAFAPAPVRVHLDMDAGTPFGFQQDPVFIDVNKAVGEVRTPLRVLPAAAVSIEPPTLAWPTADRATRSIAVRLTSHAAAPMSGTLRLNVPPGFRAARLDSAVSLEPGESRVIVFELARATPASVGSAVVRASFHADAAVFSRGIAAVDYPHIRPHFLYHDAQLHITSMDVAIAADLRVGYIEGAGDDGARALRQLGATVELLDAHALENADFSRYDAIVTGIRAYEVRPDLLRHNARLLEYARRGGTFVVQYNKYELVDGGFMPYPATMARPHGRVTDEAAPVTLLEPGHPLLTAPNRITGADFDGWVHERGLYFLETFDERYAPLLQMNDPGEAAQRGALVAARLGDGWYVYTGLALFRQLPEGVPGAYRLLANLVSLGRSRSTAP
jgi:LmbE family N-acetylglucosaminyl deacetylase